jgi:hypothetical protein
MATGARRGTGTVLAAVGVAALVTGCAGSPSAQAATRTAQAAVQASSTRDATALCALLAPQTAQGLERQRSAPCAVAALSLDLGTPSPPAPAQVWGSSALIPMGSASVFLTEMDGRWRVLAAGCRLRDGQPAECKLGGG